jgi:predicted LPLAT superfamily acyltransferase
MSPPVDDSDIEYGDHAVSQMSERKISREWVERTLHESEFVRDDKLDAEVKLSFRRIAEFGNRWLRVVYKQNGKLTHVVTVFFDRNAGKSR